MEMQVLASWLQGKQSQAGYPGGPNAVTTAPWNKREAEVPSSSDAL